VEKVTVLFRYQPGRGEELLEELRTSSEGTRAFQGCGSVDIYVDADDPDTVLLLQEWESRTQCERWIAWRIDTGLHDAVMEFGASPGGTLGTALPRARSRRAARARSPARPVAGVQGKVRHLRHTPSAAQREDEGGS